MNQEKINRINILYHKAKAEGLTETELAEQTALKKEYIEAIRSNMQTSLNHISIQERDGSITDLGKKHGTIKKI